MYVARIGDRHILKRMPETGPKHDPSCNSYEAPYELSGFGHVAGSAIQENVEDGVTVLKLDFSLSKTGAKASSALHMRKRCRQRQNGWLQTLAPGAAPLSLGPGRVQSLAPRDGGQAELGGDPKILDRGGRGKDGQGKIVARRSSISPRCSVRSAKPKSPSAASRS